MGHSRGKDYSSLTPESLCSCGCGRPVAARAVYGRKELRVQSHLSRRCLGLHPRYGITVAERDLMLKDQSGCCATCQRPIKFGDFVGGRRDEQAAIDHCHSSGVIRGILCCTCNLALGNIKDDLDTLARMYDYVRRHK